MPSDSHPTANPYTGLDARTAIDRLATEHGGRLLGLAKRFCGSADEAEDLVQEVFLRAYRSWDGYRGDARVETWLYRIAARACQRMHRPRAGEPSHTASLDATLPFGDPLIAAVPAGEHDPAEQHQRTEARERLEAAIAALPEEFRVPIVLKDIVGLPVADVAAILDLPEGTVRSRVHRARLKLREAVDGALPRDPTPAPPPAYEHQTCLDLLAAKQDAIDRGVALPGDVVCARCRSVFATLDLAHDLCGELAGGELPGAIRERLASALHAVDEPA